MQKPNVFSLSLLRERSKIDPITKCWNWIGQPIRRYPQMRLNNKPWAVSRLICEHLHGGIKPWPEQVAMHECDNSRCVNPDHIKVGTQKKNVHDCIKRGRSKSVLNGYRATAETRAKMSAAATGRKHTPEARAKMSAAATGNQKRKGCKHTPEARAKISAARKGRKATAATRAKLSAAGMGRKPTAATRAKLSAARKAYLKNKKSA